MFINLFYVLVPHDWLSTCNFRFSIMVNETGKNTTFQSKKIIIYNLYIGSQITLPANAIVLPTIGSQSSLEGNDAAINVNTLTHINAAL